MPVASHGATLSMQLPGFPAIAFANPLFE